MASTNNEYALDSNWSRRTPLREQWFLTPDEFVRTYGATQADLEYLWKLPAMFVGQINRHYLLFEYD